MPTPVQSLRMVRGRVGYYEVRIEKLMFYQLLNGFRTIFELIWGCTTSLYNKKTFSIVHVTLGHALSEHLRRASNILGPIVSLPSMAHH